MGGTRTGMVTVEDVPSKAYRGVEILLLLPIALYAMLGVGIILLGFGESEAGVMGAVAALGAWWIGGIALFFVSWLLTPFVLYLDTKKLNEADLEWQPSPVLYAVLGLFFGYLMKLHHIYKRHQYVVDWVERDFWWVFVAAGTVLPAILLALAFSVGMNSGTVLPFLLVGLAILTAVPFPLAIYRDATYVRLNSSGWRPNPGNYLNLAVFFFVLAPVAFPITGGYYLVRRHLVIGTV